MQLILSQKAPLAQIWMRQDTRCSEGKGMCLVEQQVFNVKSQHVSHRVKPHLPMGKKYGGKSLSLCFYTKNSPKQNSQSSAFAFKIHQSLHKKELYWHHWHHWEEKPALKRNGIIRTVRTTFQNRKFSSTHHSNLWSGQKVKIQFIFNDHHVQQQKRGLNASRS